jgi:hypothetical protein
MATQAQLATQIRFQLDQLSARNAHHEFEHLCRHLARLRICSNILPATGPVSAGGDHGRDFETFVTYLSESPIAGSSFVGMTSQEPVAFACTLTQKARLKRKIKSDVAVITGGGVPVLGVHYFCSSDLPVAERHKLQTWARSTYDIHLEIYDGQAISELLVESDIFWIAAQFLGIPSEMFPALSAGNKDSWYLALLDKWKDLHTTPENFADFSELKAAIRHATWAESAKVDLPFWIRRLTDLGRSTTWIPLQRRSIYEIAVASLRGLGTLEGSEEKIRSYFSEIQNLYEEVDLEDASVLLVYCAGALRRGAISLANEDLASWQKALIDKVEQDLRRTTLCGRSCSLLEIRGFLALHMEVTERKLGIQPNFPEALRYWQELVKSVGDAPLFPLERFADRLTRFVEMFGHFDDLETLASQLDQLLATRRGEAAAAEKCRDRARALYKRGELLHAINQIHRAKVKWFSEETVYEAIVAMLFLAHCYLKLGLAFAAKYHALMAAYASVRVPRENLRKLVPVALSEAALCDYRQGAWFSYLEMQEVALATFSIFSREADPADPNSEINKALYQTSWVHRLAQRVCPTLLPFIEEKVTQWGLRDELGEFLDLDDPWTGKDQTAVWQSLAEQLLGQPFADLGPQREVSFQALGVTWKFQWDNTYQTTASVEQFLAVLQIFLAELAGRDLCLLRTEVEVRAAVGKGTNYMLQLIPSNTSTKWALELPDPVQTKEDTLDVRIDILAATISLLQSASLLPDQELTAILEDLFRSGLQGKVFSVQRYDVLYLEFIVQELFECSERHLRFAPDAGGIFKTIPHELLAWVDGPGPGYSHERSKADLRRRYERTIRPIQSTIKQLAGQAGFRLVARALREDGWLDWHILFAVMHLTLNYRIQQVQRLGMSPREACELSDRWVNELEKEDGIPVPLEEFSVENLRQQLCLSMIATIRIYGLELPHATPDFEALSDFLGQRYRYWIDDVAHPDFGF